MNCHMRTMNIKINCIWGGGWLSFFSYCLLGASPFFWAGIAIGILIIIYGLWLPR